MAWSITGGVMYENWWVDYNERIEGLGSLKVQGAWDSVPQENTVSAGCKQV